MKTTEAVLTEYQIVILNLKKILKELKISYKDLAHQMGLSESGIKKIFSAKDGSFLRITQLCQAAGVSVYEMLQDTAALNVSFNKKQQDEFLRDIILFKIYWILVYERKSISMAQSILKLSHKEVFHKLCKLDSLQLLKLLPNDKLQLPTIQAVNWVGQGDFINKIYKEWAQQLLDSISKPKAKVEEFFILRYLPMTSNTYKEFQLSLMNLEDEFIRRSIHEMRTRGSKVHHVRWMVIADNRSFVGE